MKIAVVIPSYKVKRHILDVLENIGPEVSAIFVVDDACPEGSGSFVEEHVTDPRVKVIYCPENQGVGGAVMAGYSAALAEGNDIMVKIDGDGQMDAALIQEFVQPILNGQADYTKGNRFYDLEQIQRMPAIRIFGNAVLSFMSKFSTGYWNLFDPTNGYTAIHCTAARHLPMSKISKRYFFETDMLFRLNAMRAVVVDVPMDAVYGDEESNLKIGKVLPEFLVKHVRNSIKRIFYNYYLRNMSIASVELPLGLMMLLFGMSFGALEWAQSIRTGMVTSAGTVMLSGLPIILGLQLILAFLGFDIASVPTQPIQMFKRRMP